MEDFLAAVQLDYDTYILAIRSSLKTATTFIRRSPSEIRVNNYNPACLQAWRANQDIQFILDVYACASYITSYVAKGARGMSDLLRKACEETRLGNSTLKQQVRLIGNKFLNNVEVTAQEAVYLLLQLPLKRSSRQILFVNTNPPDERVYLLKSNIDKLPDDAQVAENNLLSRYAKRSNTLSHVCLADYAALYDNSSIVHTDENSDDEYADVATTDTSVSQQPKKRNTARIIRTFQFNANSDPEKAARHKLMLYFPWRNESTDLLGTFQTHLEHFESIKQQLSQKISIYEPYANEVTAAQDLLETADVHQQWDMLAPGVEQRENCSAAAGSTECEVHAAINPAAHGQTSDYDLAIDLGLGHITSDTSVCRYDMSDADYFTLMNSLNHEQLEFIYDTAHHLKTSQKPLY